MQKPTIQNKISFSLFTVFSAILILSVISFNSLNTSYHSSSSKAASAATIQIDYTQQIQQVSPLAFGMDETGYGGSNVLANDTLEQQKLKALHLGYIRMDLQYAVSGDPTSKIECGGGGCNTQYTGDQWINAIKAVGAEPAVIVHLKNNNAQDAANMVKHFNIDTHNSIKYWIIGNEPDLSPPPMPYHTYFDSYYPLMKAVDPTIKIGGPTSAWYDSKNCDTCLVYTFLQLEASKVDFLDFHGYPQSGTTAGQYPFLFNWATGTGSDIVDFRNHFIKYAPTRPPVPIEVGEWDLNSGGGAQDDINFHAVWAADVIGNILENGGNSMFYGTKTNLLYGGTKTITDQTGTSYTVNNDDTNPSYHGYGMFTGESLFRSFGTSMVKSSSSNPNVEVFSSDSPRNVVMVNKDPVNATVVTVSINGVTTAPMDVWQKNDTMRAIDPPVDKGTSTIQNGSFTYTLPPFSVSTFLINATGAVATPIPTTVYTATSTTLPTATVKTTVTTSPTATKAPTQIVTQTIAPNISKTITPTIAATVKTTTGASTSTVIPTATIVPVVIQNTSGSALTSATVTYKAPSGVSQVAPVNTNGQANVPAGSTIESVNVDGKSIATNQTVNSDSAASANTFSVNTNTNKVTKVSGLSQSNYILWAFIISLILVIAVVIIGYLLWKKYKSINSNNIKS